MAVGSTIKAGFNNYIEIRRPADEAGQKAKVDGDLVKEAINDHLAFDGAKSEYDHNVVQDFYDRFSATDDITPDAKRILEEYLGESTVTTPGDVYRKLSSEAPESRAALSNLLFTCGPDSLSKSYTVRLEGVDRAETPGQYWATLEQGIQGSDATQWRGKVLINGAGQPVAQDVATMRRILNNTAHGQPGQSQPRYGLYSEDNCAIEKNRDGSFVITLKQENSTAVVAADGALITDDPSKVAAYQQGSQGLFSLYGNRD